MNDNQFPLDHVVAGRYRIVRLLGEGGMARVYLADDARHSRQVALKVLRSDLAATLGHERFQREIATAARLQHPHILTVFDSGNENGTLWFTMPYIGGESLRSRLERERQLPLDEAIRIAREVAQALQHAHDSGVVHRDIKPDNILLTSDGNTLVADFGIARGLGGGSDTPLTRTGMALGTPAYMSPEQASGDREVDCRSDVYALGAVFYEMLAGEPPYTGPTPEAIIAKRFTAPLPSIRTTRSTVSPQLEQVISRSLALVPGDRFATVAEFSAAVGAAAGAAGFQGSAVRVDRSRMAIAALVAAILLGGAGFLLTRRGDGGAGGSLPSAEQSIPRIAILPFENRGDTADAYFADGMTDAVRGRLSALPGLQVIARGSSIPYLGSSKALSQIAGELGVRYLLTGVVRFERRQDGASVVHLTPELVEITDGTPTTRWQQAFDQPMTNVFEVQSRIADEVASRMSVALGGRPRNAIPTGNAAAYDAFLRGQALRGRSDPATLRKAVEHMSEAVQLDSMFGDAWALLAVSETNFYIGMPGGATAERAERILNAARRAIELAPDSPQSHRAMGSYYRVVAVDLDKAMAAYREGLRLDPNEASLLNSIALIHSERGELEQARATLTSAIRLDPRESFYQYRLALVETELGDYDAADQAARQASSLNPGVPNYIAIIYDLALRRGDLAGARSIVADAAKEMSPELLYTNVAVYGDFVWLLDSAAQEMVMAAPLSRYDGDRATRDMVRTQIYQLRGDTARTRLWADSARAHYGRYLRDHPENREARVLEILAAALSGRHAEARSKADSVARGELNYQWTNAVSVYERHVIARAYLVIGEHEKAIDQLEAIKRVSGNSYELTSGRLRIDPNFDPVRNNPRFIRLVESDR